MKRTFRYLPSALGLAAGLGLAASPALADTATSQMEVTASVSNSCTISAGTLAFGTYDPVVANASAELPGQAVLTVACTKDAATTIDLDQGANADTGSTDTAPLRRMSDGTNFLSYALYSDAGHATLWGTGDGVNVAYTGSGTSEEVDVFGAVAPGQNVPSGDYTDTVTTTINF